MNFSYSPLKEEDYCQLDKAGNEARTKYIGCIGVKESMRRLSHKTRSEVAKESIIRLCEANKIDRKLDRKRSGLLDDEPNLMYSGLDVILSVTNKHLSIISKDTGGILIQHEMPNVSFASSGDDDTVDFVAYVAKDDKFGRACFVLECGNETAKNVMENIAYRFSIRAEQIRRSCTLSRTSSSVNHERVHNHNDSFRSLESQDHSYDQSYRMNTNENGDDIVAITRAFLRREPWYHDTLTKEESETRLKHDGDFLVRESIPDEGNFVLSVMHEGAKLHFLFDSLNQVRTIEMKFDSISQLVEYHHGKGSPLVHNDRIVYLVNGVSKQKNLRD